MKQIGLHICPFAIALIALCMSTDAATAVPEDKPYTFEDVPAAASMLFTSDVIPAAPDDVHALKMISQALEMIWQVSHKTRCRGRHYRIDDAVGTTDDVADTPDVVSGSSELRGR